MHSAIDAGLLEAMRIGAGQRLLRVTREAHERYRKRLRSGFQSPALSIRVIRLGDSREEAPEVFLPDSILASSRMSGPVTSRPSEFIPDHSE